MIRVGFVQAWLTVGGAERLVQSLSRGMDSSRIESVAINLYEPGVIGEEMLAEGCAVVSRLAASRWDPRVAWRLARTLHRHGIDVVYVFDSALPMAWIGMLRRFAACPPYVLGFHSTGKLGDPIQHSIARATAVSPAARLVALAETHRGYLAGELGVSPGRFEVIGSGFGALPGARISSPGGRRVDDGWRNSSGRTFVRNWVHGSQCAATLR